MKISGITIQDTDVHLDFSQFEKCKFKNCRIFIHGYSGPSLEGCTFEKCKFLVADAAANTLAVFTLMYHGGMKDIVEDFIKGIVSGAFPRIDK